MKYRTVGGTGIRVSEIGFGTWGLGGDAAGSIAYGPVDRAEAVAALVAAEQRGINFFDTADLYGAGRSEEVLREAFGGRRSSVVIASKAGMLDPAGNQDFSARHLRHALEGSLRRLGSDYIDLYQLHSPPAAAITQADGPLATLAEFKSDGKVRAIGVSVRSPEDGLTVARRRLADCIQVNFNLLDQRALDSGLFAECARQGIGLIARTPLCFGFLTGQYRADQAYAASDHRSRWSDAQREKWASGPKLFAKWRSTTSETGAQFALRFCLSFPEVTSTIPGMLTRPHVEENSAASALGPLPAAALAEINSLYRQHEFFVR